ncbi:MAG: YihA family ribosome biogenesis GTP-binding protein [Ruminococcaceae bacterium]|nr:YihA family ribosome biogenesis GTP-binding protein [Oscillospiraceae bacterium]
MDCPDFNKAAFGAAYGLARQLPASSLPEFVFAGRSNVGKSSLINKLCNRKRLARVSGTPGKTATINFYGAGEAYLVDLPGYGYAKTSGAERRRWDELINGYFAGARDIRLMMQLLDCRHPPSKDDMQMLEYLAHYQIPFVGVLTKADKFKPSQYARIIEEFTGILAPFDCRQVVLTSAEKGLGIAELQAAMQQAGVAPKTVEEEQAANTDAD